MANNNEQNNVNMEQTANTVAETKAQVAEKGCRRRLNPVVKWGGIVVGGVILVGLTTWAIVKGHKVPVEPVAKIAEAAAEVAEVATTAAV